MRRLFRTRRYLRSSATSNFFTTETQRFSSACPLCPLCPLWQNGFDASSGKYKRHWGAYGNKPDDAKMRMFNPESPQFANPVHCVRLGRDNLLYVCDRTNNRIQVFEKSGKFVRQFVIEPATQINGTVHDMIISPDPLQAYLFVGNGTDGEIYIVRRDTGERVAALGRLGRMAGEFYGLHNLAVDSRANLYTAEVRTGRRVQRFTAARN